VQLLGVVAVVAAAAQLPVLAGQVVAVLDQGLQECQGRQGQQTLAAAVAAL